jgi:hypothetical protein
MVAYNFKAQFAPLVEAGIKRQTIRARGKRRHAAKGDRLQLYTGQRSPTCRKLLPDPECTESEAIAITATGQVFVGVGSKIRQLDPESVRELAVTSGKDMDSPSTSLSRFIKHWRETQEPPVSLLEFWLRLQQVSSMSQERFQAIVDGQVQPDQITNVDLLFISGVVRDKQGEAFTLEYLQAVNMGLLDRFN